MQKQKVRRQLRRRLDACPSMGGRIWAWSAPNPPSVFASRPLSPAEPLQMSPGPNGLHPPSASLSLPLPLLCIGGSWDMGFVSRFHIVHGRFGLSEGRWLWGCRILLFCYMLLFLLYAVMKDSRDRAEKEERGLQECSPLLKYKLLNLNHYIIRIRPITLPRISTWSVMMGSMASFSGCRR